MSQEVENTYRAVTELRPELSRLVGPDAWPEVARQMAHLDEQWATSSSDVEQMLITAAYRDALAAYPEAYERVNVVALGAEPYRHIARQLANMAEWEDDEDVAAGLRTAADLAQSTRIIFEKGAGRDSYSVKLSNLDFTFWNLGPALAAVLGVLNALGAATATPLTVATAILAAFGGASVFVEKIDVDKTSVFLGLVEGAGKDKQADLAAIVAATNQARQKARMARSLTEAEVVEALVWLRQLGSIEPGEQADVWRVVEEHGRIG